MATYYVRKTGSDAANGTSAATAWLTLGKACNSGGIADTTVTNTIYVGAGVYAETLAPTLTNPTAVQTFVADVDGANTGDVGEVIVSGYTSGPTSAPSATVVLNANGKNKFTWQNFVFEQGNAILLTLGTALNWTFTNCTFLGFRTTSNNLISLTTVAGTSSGHTFDRCRVFSVHTSSSVIAVTATLHTADYDVGILFRNCRFHCLTSGDVIRSSTTAGSGSGLIGGIDLESCTFVCPGAAMAFTAATHGTSIPSTAVGCLFCTGGSSLNAGTSGQITEERCAFVGPGSRANVTAGTGSVSDGSRAPRVHIGQEAAIGGVVREFFTPEATSGLLAAISMTSPTSLQTVDLLNRVRPAGGNSASAAFGALERHDTGAKDATVARTSGNSLKFTGPGDHEFKVPVDNISTTFSIYVRYASANYGAGTKPQLVWVADGEIGVTVQTATATTAAADAWEQISVTATPTNPGIATVRLISNAAAAGEMWADDFAAT